MCNLVCEPRGDCRKKWGALENQSRGDGVCARSTVHSQPDNKVAAFAKLTGTRKAARVREVPC